MASSPENEEWFDENVQEIQELINHKQKIFGDRNFSTSAEKKQLHRYERSNRKAIFKELMMGVDTQ